MTALLTIDESSGLMWKFFHEGELGIAERLAKQILTARPHHARAHCIRSILAWKRGDVRTGLHQAELAYQSDPEDIEIVRVSARQFLECGDSARAIEFFARARDLAPGIDASMDLAYALLQSGDYPMGWEMYEARIPRTERSLGMAGRPQCIWGGTPFEGTLLVLGEGGYGDMVQFARFLPKIADRARVIYKVPRALGRLMRTLDDRIEIDDGPKDVFPAFQRWIPVMSLPHILETTVETIPAPPRYLTGPLGPWFGNYLRKRLRIGIAWGGSPLLSRDTQRSMPVEFVHTLIDQHSDKDWMILQQGPHREAFGSVGDKRHVTMPEDVKDFADTADIIEGCDLVISVDTAVAHLAGALGCPTWTLLAMMPEWRWPYGATTSPWYPSMRLFRQPKPGDWQGVIDSVSVDVGAL